MLRIKEKDKVHVAVDGFHACVELFLRLVAFIEVFGVVVEAPVHLEPVLHCRLLDVSHRHVQDYCDTATLGELS